MTRGSGTASSSGVNARQGAIADVRIVIVSQISNPFLYFYCISALYEADRKAHDEAVRNGGVSPLQPFTLSYFLNVSPCP